MKKFIIVLCFAWVIPNIDWKIYLTMFPATAHVAFCESGNKNNPLGNPNALNPKDTDGLPAKGLLQFKDKTFYAWAKLAGISKPNIWDPIQQIVLYQWADENDLLNHWGCYNKLVRTDKLFRLMYVDL